jgi:hypothetical protein
MDDTVFVINFAARSFVELVKYIFTIPGVQFFLSEKISQDPIEKFKDKGGYFVYIECLLHKLNS